MMFRKAGRVNFLVWLFTIAAVFISFSVKASLAGMDWTYATGQKTLDWPIWQHTSVVFNDKIWVIGGVKIDYENLSLIPKNEVQYSSDGIDWTLVTNSAPWEARRSHTSVVFKNKIWVIGGANEDEEALSDVWCSSDGVNWTQTTASAPWGRRVYHTSVVFDNKLWVLGGSDSAVQWEGNDFNDVWYSADGINWSSATNGASWPARGGHTSVVFDDKMWIIGGYYHWDVWCSSNGLDWTLATDSTPLSCQDYSSVVFDDKIWVIGGTWPDTCRSKIWCSTDGVNWSVAVDEFLFQIDGHSTNVFDNKIWIIGGVDYQSCGPLHQVSYSDNGTSWAMAVSSDPWPARGWHTSVAFNSKMWVVGGYGLYSTLNDVWYSDDGVSWSMATASAPWGPMGGGHTSVVFNNKIWFISGSVWHSPDGISWEQATDVAPYGYREGHSSVVFDDKIWVIGGFGNDTLWRDVWYSSDGANWIRATDSAPWQKDGHSSVVFDNRMWVIGGGGGGGFEGDNDVWYSTDGVSWHLATGSAPWPPRMYHTSVVYDDKIWVIGGVDGDVAFNDVWYSSDGVNWTQVTASAEWVERFMQTSVVFNNKIWLMGGTGWWQPFNDVWYSTGLPDKQDIKVTASANYDPNSKQLTISATGYNRSLGTYVSTGVATYGIASLGKSGNMTYNGNVWTAAVDLSSEPPAPGQYTILVTIQTGSTTCTFNAVGNNGEIAGTIKDVNDVKLTGINVALYNNNDYYSPNPVPVDVCSTDSNGFYSFVNLEPDWYVVDVNTTGYLPQRKECLVTSTEGTEVDFVLSQQRTLANLIFDMNSLAKDVERTMVYDTNLMSKISTQAVRDLSASLDAWDLASFFGSLLADGATSEILETITNEGARQAMQEVIKEVALRETLKAVAKEGIDLVIQESAKALLPEGKDSWEQWSEEELKDVNVWNESRNWLADAENEFEVNAPSITVTEDFDYSTAKEAINSQKHQLRQVNDGIPVCLIALANPYGTDPCEGFYGLGTPSGYQLWLIDHAAISLFGGLNKVFTTVQIGSGAVAVATTVTGVGAPIGGAAATVCAVSTKAQIVSGVAEVVMKFHGALTYALNAKSWAQDIAALPLSYTKTKAFLEHEATDPYYLSDAHSFSADASLDLNTWVPNTLIPLPFQTIIMNNALVEVTNTSDVAATVKLVPFGWWDYKLPGDWWMIGELFGRVTSIKVPTTTGAPVSVELPPGGSEIVSVPYLGFYCDPVNMYSYHWLQVDVYTGPLFQKSIVQPYLVYKVTFPLMAGQQQRMSQYPALVASFEEGNQSKLVGLDDFSSMAPSIITLAEGIVDGNNPVIEEQYTVDSNSWSVCFELCCDSIAHIALQVYDIHGNCVGYNTAQGGIQNEFIATYTGNGSGNQNVDIPSAAGKTYTVKVVLEGAGTPGPFNAQLFAFETPIRPPVQAVMPDSVSISTQPINTVELGITIGEAGHQKPLQDVIVTLSDLNDVNNFASLPIIGPNSYDINDISAGSSESISFTVSIPKEVPVGDYTGEITVSSSNAGTIIVPVTITNDDIAEDLTRDGTIDYSDISDFASQWLQTSMPLADFNRDGNVNFVDFARLADKWLREASWYED